MRKLLFALPFALLLACSGNNEKSGQEKKTEAKAVAEARKYACPMQCEGDKTYAEAGKCPVCKMDLQEVAMAESDSTAHGH